METFNIKINSDIYGVRLKSQNPLRINVIRQHVGYEIGRDFFGKWYDNSRLSALEDDIIEEIGNSLEARGL